MLHMSQQVRLFWFWILALAALSCVQSAVSQVPHRFALDQFEDIRCRANGRLQDCSTGYPVNPVTTQVLAAGKRSIPVLISQISETARTKDSIIDFWSYTTSGDVAFFFLTDLFTDKDGKSFTMPGVPNWEKIMSGCNGPAETCWRKYTRTKGISSVQQSWQTAWETNRNRIIWDTDTRCFRLRK
jgi:hypothetical protein